jgi:hypothetical protein
MLVETDSCYQVLDLALLGLTRKKTLSLCRYKKNTSFNVQTVAPNVAKELLQCVIGVEFLSRRHGERAVDGQVTETPTIVAAEGLNPSIHGQIVQCQDVRMFNVRDVI